jgi:hypothetical protein
LVTLFPPALSSFPKKVGHDELFVHAVPDAVGFYEKLGYSRFEFQGGGFESVQLHKLI